MDFLVAVEWKFLWSLILIISFKCNGTLSDLGKMSSPQNHFGNSAQSQFATRNSTRVIAQKGGLAILPCVVKLNSPATVSWIRRRDFQLLTVGLSTHSSDKRFLVEHTRHMGHWSLRIKSVREEDRGFYECQLSIYPTQSIFIELKVVEAVAEITGAPDLHIDEGSTLRLECRLKRATENPAFVFWYHDSKMVNYDAQDGFSVSSTTANLPTDSSTLAGVAGINGLLPVSVTISPSLFDTQAKDRADDGDSGSMAVQHQQQMGQQLPHQSSYLLTPSTSLLTIQEVHFHHAGNYTCKPSNARPASITVHVLRGEKPAAMQHANRSSIFDNSNSHGSASTNNNSNIGAIGASTSSGMVPFAKNSLVLMLFSSLHLAYWQLCKLFDMTSTHKKEQKQGKAQLKRKSSSSLLTPAAAAARAACHCHQSSKHFQCCYALPQNSRKPPQKHQQQQNVKKQENCSYNLHLVLNRITEALIFYYHKIES